MTLVKKLYLKSQTGQLGILLQFLTKSNKYDPSNYRPISSTSTVCKLMESRTGDYIMNFFQSNYFSKNQHGFIKGRSTALQLLCILDDWTRELDKWMSYIPI